MKFKKPQQFIQQFASTSGSSLFAQIFSALTSLLILYGSILLLWQMVKLFRREHIHPWLPVCNQFPCTTCDVSVSTFENNVCRETTSFKPFNPPKCYSEEKQKRWERIFVLTNFANANFRPGEISLLWDAKFCQDDSEIWNSRALGRILVMSFHRMFAKIKEIGEFHFIFARHHIRNS